MDESPETSRSVHPNSLDIARLFLEAHYRWLSPAEICEILRNYKQLQIASESPNKPPSGSLFLFDRKVTRNFRKDGHNWQRKENGKLAKEGHKKLKAGSIDGLHCYYALGEENKNFQRRCYSMLEKDFSHIVLVHYQELTVTEKIMPNSEIDGSLSSGSCPNNCLEDTCLNSAQPLERENARSATPEIDLAPMQSDKGKSDNDAEPTDDCLKYLNLASWKGDFESCHPCSESMDDQSLSSSSHPDTVDKLLTDSFDRRLDFKEHSQIYAESKVHPDIRNDNFVDSGANSEKVENENEIFSIPFEEQLDIFIRGPSLSQEKLEEQSLVVPISSINLDNQDDVGSGPKAVQNISEISTTAPSLGNTSDGLQAGKGMNDGDFGLSYESQEFRGQPEMQEECQMHPTAWRDYSMENDCQTQLSNRVDDYVLPNDSDGYLNMEGKSIYPPALRQHLLDGSLTEEGLEIDSFIPGMSERSEEIRDVTELDESRMQYCAGVNRETVCNRNGIAGYLADHSLDVHIPSINLDDSREAMEILRTGEGAVADPGAVAAKFRDAALAADTAEARVAAAVNAKAAALARFVAATSAEGAAAAQAEVLAATAAEAKTAAAAETAAKAAAKVLAAAKVIAAAKVLASASDEEEDEGPDDEGPEGGGPEGGGSEGGPEKDEGPEKEKEEGKKRAPDSALESGKGHKIPKAYSAYMALLTAYYLVQSMETIQMLVLVSVEASKKTGERKLSYIDDGFELSMIRG